MERFDWQTRFAGRIGGTGFGKSTGLYKFERIKRAKEAAALAHPELPLIDLGIGEGDRCADERIVETLAREAGRAENRRYADNGTVEFRQAAANYMERAFGVPGLDPATEVLPSIGSKSLLAMLPACFIDPGDVLLMPVPSYPVAANWTRFLGGQVYELPLLEENAFLPDLDSIPTEVLARAKMLYLNYPNNPTGAAASPAFFARVVEFAKRHGIVVVHDAAYAALSYDGRLPLSFLSVPGARDVGVEVHSLSKSFNMTGWRAGFLCGNANAVAACAAVKDTTDAGQFRAIQKAGVAALGIRRLPRGRPKNTRDASICSSTPCDRSGLTRSGLRELSIVTCDARRERYRADGSRMRPIFRTGCSARRTCRPFPGTKRARTSAFP